MVEIEGAENEPFSNKDNCFFKILRSATLDRSA